MGAEDKKIEYLVVDTTAFIQNAQLQVRILSHFKTGVRLGAKVSKKKTIKTLAHNCPPNHFDCLFCKRNNLKKYNDCKSITY